MVENVRMYSNRSIMVERVSLRELLMMNHGSERSLKRDGNNMEAGSSMGQLRCSSDVESHAA